MFVETEERKQGEVTEAPKVLDEPSLLLLKVADAIEREGLSCGGSTDSQGKRCVARHAAMLGDGNVYYLALTRLEILPEIFDIGIGEWSDTAGREGRAAEVVAKLREVALK